MEHTSAPNNTTQISQCKTCGMFICVHMWGGGMFPLPFSKNLPHIKVNMRQLQIFGQVHGKKNYQVPFILPACAPWLWVPRLLIIFISYFVSTPGSFAKHRPRHVSKEVTIHQHSGYGFPWGYGEEVCGEWLQKPSPLLPQME